MFPFSIRFVMFTSFFSLGLLGYDQIVLCDDSQSDSMVAKTATEALLKAQFANGGLKYNDSNLPTHYSFKSKSKFQKLEVRYQILIQGGRPKVSKSNLRSLRKDADRILGELDSESRWVTDKNGIPSPILNRQDLDLFFLESNVFSKNLTSLAEFVTAAKHADKVP